MKQIICSIFLILLFNSCKKYPEGPLLSFRTVLTRLQGTYVLEKYEVNGIDSTNLIPPCYQLYNFIPDVSPDGKYYFNFDRHNNIKGMDGTGGYYLQGKKKDIDLSYVIGNYPSTNTQGRNILQPVKSSEGVWQIRKLTNKEFWIKESLDGLTFEVHLKKIKS